MRAEKMRRDRESVAGLGSISAAIAGRAPEKRNALYARAFVGPMTASERYLELAEHYGRTKLQARDDFSRHLLQSLEETYRGLAEGAALLERSTQVPITPEKRVSAKSA